MWQSVAVLANFANLLKTRIVPNTHVVFPLSANYYNILLLVLGTGAPKPRRKEGQREKFK